MMIILTVLSLAVFFIPSKYKYAFILTVISAGVVVAVAQAVAPFGLAFGFPEYADIHNIIFGGDLPRIDMLSSLFIIAASVAALSVTIYARDYVGAYGRTKSPVQVSLHYAALAVLYFSMIFVVSFRTGFAFLFSWELMTISSFFLILFEAEKREVRRAAINYLILMHVGFIFILVGFVLGSGNGSLGGFDSLRAYFASNNPLPLFLMFFIGFGMKAGIFPLHVWLPEAHPAAPSHVSALMSGVMIKMGVYGVLRVLTYVDGGLYTIGVVVLVTGIVTSLWGIIMASLQNDLKKLLAYSSIENIGIIFTAIGIGAVGRAVGNELLAALGFAGALLHVVNHSLFKPLLFMSAGSVYLSTHTRNIDELGGLSKRMPVTTLLFLTGALAICALPPLNGFVSEFMIYLGLLDSVSQGSEVLLSVMSLAMLALVGGVAVLVFAKAFGVGFLGNARCCKAADAREVSGRMLAAQCLPVAGIVLIGIFPGFFAQGAARVVSSAFGIETQQLFDDFVMRSMTNVSAVALILIVVTCVIYFLKRAAQRRRRSAVSPTWGCGFTAPTKFMQYTGESFSEGLSRLTSSVTGDSGQTGDIGKDEIFATPRDFDVNRRDRIDSRVSQLWGYVVHKVNSRLSFFQTGRINHYILHMLLFLVFIFLLTVMKII